MFLSARGYIGLVSNQQGPNIVSSTIYAYMFDPFPPVHYLGLDQNT